MARYTDADCKRCRREKVKLFLKGSKCESPKCPFEKRPYPPGQHGRGRSKDSEYLLQLREKQKATRMYGVLEKQFSNYFKEAQRQSGKTGENLLQLLECRLDNVVYRMGFGTTRAEARQLVSHRAVMVNGHVVNIPSYQVGPSDVVAIRERAKSQTRIVDALTVAEQMGFPEWLDVDVKKMQGIFKSVPERGDLPAEINESLVVELYSK